MVQSRMPNVPDIKIIVDEPPFVDAYKDANLENKGKVEAQLPSWHIPRPTLLTKSEKSSDNGSYKQKNLESPSRGSTSSNGSTASSRSAASGTLLLTAANLANLASTHPPTIIKPKEMDTASIASSTHFTVVNGIGRPVKTYQKSWCARNQLTVLVCTMCFLFMVGLLAGILYMDMRVKPSMYD